MKMYKEKQKKAQDNNPLFSTIFFAIVLAIMLWLAYSFVIASKGVIGKELCLTTASAKANTAFFGFESPIIQDLKCDTNYIKVKPDGIYTYDEGKYKKDILYRDFKKDPENYEQKIIADELYKCWKFLGAGGIDPFGNYDDSTKCVVCSQIEFDPEIREKTPKFEKFDTFLKQNYVKGDTGVRETYWDYITGGAIAPEGEELSLELETEPQSIIFKSIKPDKKWELLGDLAATGAGATGCTTFPAAITGLGWSLGKLPKVGKYVQGLQIGAKIVGSRAGRAGAKAFAFTCKGDFLRQGKVVQKGAFYAGTAFTVKNAAGDEIPRVVGVEIIPTADTGAECEKLYG